MKTTDYIKCINDTEYVKITYTSSFSSGCLLFKKSFYELNIKRIDRLLKKCDYRIINDYQITFDEFVSLDEEMNQLLKAEKRYSHLAKYYKDHYEYKLAEEYEKYRIENNDYINRRLHELEIDFKKKGGEL